MVRRSPEENARRIVEYLTRQGFLRDEAQTI
jgi:hypothetical protein